MRRSTWTRYLCNNILVRRAWLIKCRNECFWTVLNLGIVFLLILDAAFGIFRNYCSFYSFLPKLFFWIEIFLALIYTVNVAFHFYLYLWPSLEPPYPVPLSWKELLSIPCKGEEFKYWKFVTHEDRPGHPKRYVAPRREISPPSQHLTRTKKRQPGRVGGILRLLTHSSLLEPPPPAPRRLTDMQALVRSFTPQIETAKDLINYLINYEDRKQKAKLMNKPLKNWKGFTPPGTLEHLIAILQKYRYQPYVKIPSPLDDDPPSGCSENVRTKLQVTDEMLSVWSERLRKWICQTIIAKIVDEIDVVNKKLVEMRWSELKIGETNLFTLRQIAILKSNILPTLPAVIPYLEVALNQEYLVKRLRDLASGGCMRLYNWNAGGTSKMKEWSKDSPPDSTIVFHLFCTYLDVLLPYDFNTAEKKSFTNNYFRKVPDKPVFQKGKHYIYQSKKMPPHYVVVIDDEVYGLPKGSSNLFCAISLFLHYLKTKQNGMLGRVKLGPSGLNVLWTLEW